MIFRSAAEAASAVAAGNESPSGRAYQYPPAAPAARPAARSITPARRRMALFGRPERDLADHGFRFALHLGRHAEQPASGHRKLGLERVDAGLAARHWRERRGHLGHAFR